MTDDDAIMETFRDEGWKGTNKVKKDPADPGGATNMFGITLKTYAEWLKMPIDDPKVEEALGMMGEAEAKLIMKRMFLEPHRILDIPNEWVRHQVINAAWHHGPKNAVRMLQRAIGVLDDGVIGTVTLAAVPMLEEGGKKLARFFLAERMEFVGRWAAGNMTDADKDGIPDRLEFTPGILNRIGRLQRRVA